MSQVQPILRSSLIGTGGVCSRPPPPKCSVFAELPEESVWGHSPEGCLSAGQCRGLAQCWSVQIPQENCHGPVSELQLLEGQQPAFLPALRSLRTSSCPPPPRPTNALSLSLSPPPATLPALHRFLRSCPTHSRKALLCSLTGFPGPV